MHIKTDIYEDKKKLNTKKDSKQEDIIFVQVLHCQNEFKIVPSYEQLQSLFSSYLKQVQHQIDKVFDIDFYQQYKIYFQIHNKQKQIQQFLGNIKQTQNEFFKQKQTKWKQDYQHRFFQQLYKNYKLMKIFLKKFDFHEQQNEIFRKLDIFIFQKYNIKSVKNTIKEFVELKEQLKQCKNLQNFGYFCINIKNQIDKTNKIINRKFRQLVQRIPQFIENNLKSYEEKILGYDNMLNKIEDNYVAFLEFFKSYQSCIKFFCNFQIHLDRIQDFQKVFEIEEFQLKMKREIRTKFDHVIFMINKVFDIFYIKQDKIENLKQKFSKQFKQMSLQCYNKFKKNVKELKNMFKQKISLKNLYIFKQDFQKQIEIIESFQDEYEQQFIKKNFLDIQIKRIDHKILDKITHQKFYLKLVDLYIDHKNLLFNSTVDEFDDSQSSNEIKNTYNQILKNNIQIESITNQITKDFQKTQKFITQLEEYQKIEYNFPISEFKKIRKSLDNSNRKKKIYCFRDLGDIKIKLIFQFFEILDKKNNFKGFSLDQNLTEKILSRKNTILQIIAIPLYFKLCR